MLKPQSQPKPQLISADALDITLEDLESSELALQQSLSNFSIPTFEWDRIKLQNQFSDLHIEEL